MTDLPRFVSRVDPRDLKGARVVADRNGYYDSQNIVALGGASGVPATYSVVFHHSENREGGPGLRLLNTRSTDGGSTWSVPIPIDTPDRQSHDGYHLLHRSDDGRERIFVFYGWNVGSQYPEGADEGLIEIKRTDMQLDEGYWFRVSDDSGRTWGAQRYPIPVRRTRIDRDNPWGGATMGMFLFDKPSVIDGAVYMAFQKTRAALARRPARRCSSFAASTCCTWPTRRRRRGRRCRTATSGFVRRAANSTSAKNPMRSPSATRCRAACSHSGAPRSADWRLRTRTMAANRGTSRSG